LSLAKLIVGHALHWSPLEVEQCKSTIRTTEGELQMSNMLSMTMKIIKLNTLEATVLHMSKF
jgi:hypothetical protein